MPTPHTAAFIDALRAAFAAHADPLRAGEMQAYMKSALPFHGIPAPLRRSLSADVVKAHPAPVADRAGGGRHRPRKMSTFEASAMISAVPPEVAW